MFDWTVLSSRYDILLFGLATTLTISGVVLVAGSIGGLILCFARLSASRVFSALARGYITFFRLTPELVLIFWIYFCLPAVFDLRASAWVSGTLALALVASAYLAEIYRAGIEAVPRGQIEAAKALGLPIIPIWLKVLVPQAVRRMTPAFLNYFTEILKNSTLLAGIGVGELAYQAYTVGAMTFRYLELFSAVALLFFVIIFPISAITRIRERMLSDHSGGSGAKLRFGYTGWLGGR